MGSNSNINKCPACGALREAMAAVCQDCGYVYTEVNTKVVEDINNQIQGLKSSSNNINILPILRKSINRT